jgi:hypothetical protein
MEICDGTGTMGSDRGVNVRALHGIRVTSKRLCQRSSTQVFELH